MQIFNLFSVLPVGVGVGFRPRRFYAVLAGLVGARFELGQVIGEKVGVSMKNKISYSDGLMKEVRVIKDFLPPPEKLAFREEKVKVTIALSKTSVQFFKQEAAKHQVSYQKMIRRLLDEYRLQHQAELALKTDTVKDDELQSQIMSHGQL